jgi:hypothetical protein
MGQPLAAALATLPKSRLRYNAIALDAPLAAARFGYRYFHDWQDLSGEQQAHLIAAYRAERGMDAYQSHEAAKGR